MSTFAEVFSKTPPLIGVVHLPALPGSPDPVDLGETVKRAVADVRCWFEGGADAVLVENFGDQPFCPGRVAAVTVASLARVIVAVQKIAAGPVGVNVLRNDAESALSLAAALDLDFVRVNVHTGVVATDQGLLEGRAHASLRLRASLPGAPLILADVHVKHGRSLLERDVVEEARDVHGRGSADALLVTGSATGQAPDLEELTRLRAALPEVPLLLASGVTPELLRASLPAASGWIVGTWAKEGARTEAPPEVSRVRQLRAARDQATGS